MVGPYYPYGGEANNTLLPYRRVFSLQEGWTTPNSSAKKSVALLLNPVLKQKAASSLWVFTISQTRTHEGWGDPPMKENGTRSPKNQIPGKIGDKNSNYSFSLRPINRPRGWIATPLRPVKKLLGRRQLDADGSNGRKFDVISPPDRLRSNS